MLKKDIVAKLTELGIEFDPKATVAVLEALLPESERVADTTSEAAVYGKSGQHIRTYTREQHGEAFEDLANEFAGHTPDSEVRVK